MTWAILMAADCFSLGGGALLHREKRKTKIIHQKNQGVYTGIVQWVL